MKTITINYSDEEYNSFIVDVKCHEERLVNYMKMVNDEVAMVMENNLNQDDINYWSNLLDEQVNKAKAFKSLKNKLSNNSEIELNDDEYDELITLIIEEIEYGKDRLIDYKSGRFSWGEQMIPYETADIERRKELYKKLEGKEYNGQ